MAIDNQIIRSGSRKRWVEMVQKQLIRENPSALPNFGVDGGYGEETADWVMRFQEKKGLQVDGIAGPDTLQQLRSDIVLRPGDSGNGVELLQEDLAYFYIQQTAIDGEYGPGTQQGVRDFQFLNNLVVDGSAGPNTLKKMDELLTTIIVQSGDSGSLVRRIQEQLNEQDEVSISISVDGTFGSATEQAVRDFQNATNQREDGIAGPVTMNLLDLEAFHPTQESDLNDFLSSSGYDLQVSSLNDTETEELTDVLYSNNAFQNNLPSQANDTISDPEASLVTREYGDYNSTLYMVSGSLNADGYVVTQALFNEDKELLGFVFVIVDGDLYDSPAQMIYYDVDGEELDNVEDEYIEFVNDSLEGQKAITEYLLNNEVSIQSERDVCDVIMAAGVGVVCGTPGVFAGSLTAGAGWLLFAAGCTAIYDVLSENGACS